MAMVEQATQGRREQILEATLRVIGRAGRESVTHRAVAEEAGVPLGSTTYYFDSRDDLLRQALEYVASHEVERYGRLGEELRSVKSGRELADRLLSELVSAAEDRVAYIAEYELWLEAGRRPELREAAQSWCDAEQHSVAGAMETLGSSDPRADASLVVAALDGLGERLLAREDDPAQAAKELRPDLRRLIERLVG
ncbi:MAG TPA: TetR family transcriptional regulator [Solirubrobacterales bacterium]|jgi:DNA-binding transcriptional regulator YbjK|nr:TetR family transcriptional regulator [Solirubrobacterales bacterium]